MTAGAGHAQVAVVGAGAAGTLTAMRVLDAAGVRRLPLDVVLIDPAYTTGHGMAYGTSDPRHLLNVPAGSMGARPEDPADFQRWMAQRWARPVDADEFVPRHHYGRYLATRLEEATRAAAPARLLRWHGRAVGLAPRPDGATVHLAHGSVVDADAVVLAVGNIAIDQRWAPPELRESGRFVADPWAPGRLDAVPDDQDVLVVGTGLSMVDVSLTLDCPGRTVHAVSRRGLLPRRHSPVPAPPMATPVLPCHAGLEQLRHLVLRQVARARRLHGDWRPALDSLRPLVQAMWRGLSVEERDRFRAEYERVWEVHRHRLPPASAAALERGRAAGRLAVHTGGVSCVTAAEDGLAVRLSDGSELRVGAVVNCAGPLTDLAAAGDPLLDGLLDTGLARPGPGGMGLDTDDDGRLLPRAPRMRLPLFTLGAPRRGTLWETTAIPEIRVQAARLAETIVDGLDPAASGVTSHTGGVPLRRRPCSGTATTRVRRQASAG